MVYALIYIIIALALMTAAAGVLGWQLWRALGALKRSERECQGLQRDRAIRQNLQHMLNSRNAEIKRLRSRLRLREDELAELEKQTSELNLSLFHENGMRILREKEDGARRMKMELMERQLDSANRQIKQLKADAQANEVRLSGIIAEQQARIDKLNARLEKANVPARRAARRAAQELPDQVTLDDLLGG